MKGNFRIPSLCTVCFCHCVVTGYFEVIKLKQSRSRPGVVQRVPGKYISQISWQRYRMVVSFSALRTIRLYPQELHEVLISVKGSVDPRVIVRPERLCKWKIPMKPSGIEISRSGLDLNIYRWTIFSNTIWSFYYTYASCTACNPVAPPIISEGLKYKRSLWIFLKSLIACCYIRGFVYVFLFCSGPTSEKFLMTVDTVLTSGVYYLLPVYHEYFKVRIQFWASGCLLAYFLTFYVTYPACVPSKDQTQKQFPLPFSINKSKSRVKL